MKIAIVTANLGNFDTPVDPIAQDLPEGTELTFHRFTDADFPPVTGLTPRFQYRIPKLFAYEMLLAYDIYIWIDASMSLQDKNSVRWFLDVLAENDMAFFRHPWRKTIEEEATHIEEKLKEGNKYITSRYKNGFHMKYKGEAISNEKLYASTAFIYKNPYFPHLQNRFDNTKFFEDWWLTQSRYYTVDQLSLSVMIAKYKDRVRIKTIDWDIFNMPFISLVSHHK